YVKVFPAAHVGGEKYIKSLKASFPQVPIIAAGGITQQTAASYILAGATAIGVGNELIPHDALANRESARIRELARRFNSYVQTARSKMPPQAPICPPTKTDFSKFHKDPLADKPSPKK